MVARNRARFLAPIALAAAIAGTIAVVHAGLAPKHVVAHSTSAGHGRGRRHGRKFYLVQPGDSLTSIAAKTRVPLTELEALNPAIDPNALQTGQRVRLRR